MRYENGFRKWLISRIDQQTSPDLELPEDSLVYESRLNLTWWQLDNDAAWSQRHRVYQRLQGVALGTTLGMNWQFETKPWGAIDVNTFTPVDPRNDPENFQWNVTQWFWADGT